jgi:molybdenum cofactor cytidylyltransferase
VSDVVAAIILAAGASSRMGRPKALLLDQDGMAFIRRAASIARDAGCAPIHIVTGDGNTAEAIALAIGDINAAMVNASDWTDGMHRSIAAGIASLEPLADVSAAIVLPCDQPALSGNHLAMLIATWRERRTPMVASARDGRGGIPALFARSVWPILAKLPPGEGARALLRDASPDVAHVALASAAAADVDTPADYARYLGDAATDVPSA